MKKLLFVLLSLGTLLARASTHAQSIKLKAVVPFNFVVTGRALPSGEYEIRSERDIHVLSRAKVESILGKPVTFTIEHEGFPTNQAGFLPLWRLVFPFRDLDEGK
ncbi:MAG: hypothetical protein ABSE28_19985 [Candidatus Sulfotelmatobacter sp.]|jgi:hypothetical protein